jgi:hemerythrin-like domain-containing protein
MKTSGEDHPSEHRSPGTPERRWFVKRAGAALFGAALYAPALAAQSAAPTAKEKTAEEVSPTEDLMREHGVLNRILLIYDEIERRIDAHKDCDPKVVTASAEIIRNFIEQYHEKLEENYVFPRFIQAGRLTDLVQVLLIQHAAGRDVTARILQLANARTQAERARLRSALHSFVRMYRPHEAREDTVLFPELHHIVSQHEFDSLGEEFEKQEQQLFGADGFEKMVSQVGELEKQLGIFDLAQFTPKS